MIKTEKNDDDQHIYTIFIGQTSDSHHHRFLAILAINHGKCPSSLQQNFFFS